MDSQNSPKNSKSFSSKIFTFIYKIVGFLLGARIFMTVLLTFALYVSTFFLFNQMESLRAFVFDFKVHGIIFCTILTISAGGIINQFYDREKDKLTKPFRSRIQSFIRQKYYLYSYIVLNSVSLTIAFLISPRVFGFFLFYQFLMWFYSHKLAKMLIINNLTFVSLALYPFFGMLVYYQTFSDKVFLMAVFLFLVLLIMDILKDQLTKKADLLFNYHTLATDISSKINKQILILLMIFNSIISSLIIISIGANSVMSYYFIGSLVIHLLIIFILILNKKNSNFISLNLFRIWIFIGILSMLTDGIITKY
ncbi:UbiA family prenyltransferase [Frigoriflavimonas asaccharolytica]|uniref:4-hydroxybenzoate polyprenyltransferase n=1 Tax=Frigoriflavimonas asaccharolytica TaxID=2735899 RepID=A0A8J8G626_9FLAO|nr:UbiA family prenyltransferase [Frigoriflavimonas asaccharolytica]NRS91914.1 4-hydroxybenzoate polyprenyltransferase [Frigoriflavimonas asaccharolytica]